MKSIFLISVLKIDLLKKTIDFQAFINQQPFLPVDFMQPGDFFDYPGEK